jgi:anionic cell wall polymer biosynthesis LytR-Cps2A-Psr (LCP) family protein
MLEKFLPRVTTNLTEKDILTLLLMAVKRKDYSIESMAIPVTGTWQYATIQGKAVIQIDFAANAKAWYDKITGK